MSAEKIDDVQMFMIDGNDDVLMVLALVLAHKELLIDKVRGLNQYSNMHDQIPRMKELGLRLAEAREMEPPPFLEESAL